MSKNSRTPHEANLLVIQERGVLFGVEHLKKCTGRVAIDSPTNLVNLIYQDQRILDSDTLESLNNLSGQGTVDTRTLE